MKRIVVLVCFVVACVSAAYCQAYRGVTGMCGIGIGTTVVSSSSVQDNMKFAPYLSFNRTLYWREDTHGFVLQYGLKPFKGVYNVSNNSYHNIGLQTELYIGYHFNLFSVLDVSFSVGPSVYTTLCTFAERPFADIDVYNSYGNYKNINLGVHLRYRIDDRSSVKASFLFYGGSMVPYDYRNGKSYWDAATTAVSNVVSLITNSGNVRKSVPYALGLTYEFNLN